MPKYAQFDDTVGPPYPILGWYDTDALTYDNLPPASVMALITDGQWAARVYSDFWAIDADRTTPIPHTPVVVFNLSQQAVLAISAGMTITLVGTVALDATLFPTDIDTQSKLTAVIATINATGNFPNNVQLYPMKDSHGSWHTFTISQYLAIAGAIANYVSTLNLIADGNPFGAASLPDSSIILVV